MVWSCLLEVPLLRKWLMTLTGSLVSVVFNHLFLQSVVCVHWWSGEREQPGTCSMSYPYTLQSLWTGCDCLMFIFLHSFMQFCQFSVLVRMYLCRNTKVVHSIINKKKTTRFNCRNRHDNMKEWLAPDPVPFAIPLPKVQIYNNLLCSVIDTSTIKLIWIIFLHINGHNSQLQSGSFKNSMKLTNGL